MQTNTLTTRIQVLSHQNTVFHELIKPVVRQDFEQLAKVHHVGQKFRAASRWDQFIAILMSQFSCRQSLRDIQSNLECQQEKLSHLGAKSIPRSTLARINEQQPCINSYFTSCLNTMNTQKSLINFALRIPCIPWMPVILTCRFPYVNGPKFTTQKPA